MSAGSSVKRRRGGIPASEDSIPGRTTIYKASGQIPACLVNASVTYCSNDQIYAFGGFDQYTDEGMSHTSYDTFGRCIDLCYASSRVSYYALIGWQWTPESNARR